MQAVPEIPDFAHYVPAYFPIHLTLRVNTDFTHTQLQRDIDEKISVVKKIACEFIDDMAGTCPLRHPELAQDFLKKQTQSYALLVESKYRLQMLQTLLRQMQLLLAETRRFEEDVSLANYASYCETTKDNFADAIVKGLETSQRGTPSDTRSDPACIVLLKADAWYQYIKNAFFVLQHPEDPIPDDKEDGPESEDLAVEGGKISLKDPLSLNYYVEPMMAIPCKHIFEKEHIMRLFSKDRSIMCPITGCVAEITRKDLLPDLLMQLRVKVYKASEKTRLLRAMRVS
ncbi:hypothetical protein METBISCDRAFT_21307 [Metschnikowia bicuspidata]|uniref:SP-RING-type domain-containing protein n=1 Tax=Metschnikowia bicuspidata TaxID=27322 RepID=A0A4P9ZKF4_9ASCO|nr:hypothetical protein METBISCDRAFT_21307 [Metschnikowia bicuspidata]